MIQEQLRKRHKISQIIDIQLTDKHNCDFNVVGKYVEK